jgi:hypothetical protein
VGTLIASRAGGFEAIGCGGHRPLTEAAFVATEGGRRGLSIRLLALDGRIVEALDWPFAPVGRSIALRSGAFSTLLKAGELGGASTLAGKST